MLTRSTTAIDCPSCERMGRVTVIMPDGHLSTATCQDCNGEGFREPCTDPGCIYCIHVASKQQPTRPMFEWSTLDAYA